MAGRWKGRKRGRSYCWTGLPLKERVTHCIYAFQPLPAHFSLLFSLSSPSLLSFLFTLSLCFFFIASCATLLSPYYLLFVPVSYIILFFYAVSFSSLVLIVLRCDVVSLRGLDCNAISYLSPFLLCFPFHQRRMAGASFLSFFILFDASSWCAFLCDAPV